MVSVENVLFVDHIPLNIVFLNIVIFHNGWIARGSEKSDLTLPGFEDQVCWWVCSKQARGETKMLGCKDGGMAIYLLSCLSIRFWAHLFHRSYTQHFYSLVNWLIACLICFWFIWSWHCLHSLRLPLHSLIDGFDLANLGEPWFDRWKALSFSRTSRNKWYHLEIDTFCSYGPLPVISTYNPIYRLYNPIYNQL